MDDVSRRLCEYCGAPAVNVGRRYTDRSGTIRFFCARPKLCLEDFWNETGVRKPGDVMDEGDVRDLHYVVTYTGGVGQKGVGRGVFDWHVDVTRTVNGSREFVAEFWMAGDGLPPAQRIAMLLAEEGKL